MTFDRTWVLAIAWLPLAWILFEWRRTARKLGLVLKAACFTAILLALAEPRMILQETKVALAVLVDTSASSSAADLERASQLAQTMSGARGRHWMRVVPFARSTRDLTSGEQQNNSQLTSTSGEAGRATDLEAAVREAIASLPAGMVPRVALISDGKENKGSIARAAWQAQQLGIPIDTFALAGRAEPALRLESVSLPSIAFTGEQFPIDVVVSSPSTGPAQVELSAEGKPLGQTAGDPESRRQSAAAARQPEYAGRAGYRGGHPRRGAGRSAFRSGRGPAAAEGAVHNAGHRRAGFAFPGHARERAVRCESRQRSG